MFEDVVKGVLEGYLGRFVKGIRKDQLKIGIWNEEILLEKVELILEAFDYLQLPFALRNGRVGKLSIKIPWKKLGWDPIIVVLENVLICASQREDIEWCFDSVERRELAGKMAKLNAIELAKLSSRVSDNQAGQSFISYIYAKILDNIQVSIRDIHVVYVDSHKDQENFIFGLKLSSLTVMTDAQKHSYTGYSVGKSRVGQVKKIVEISNIGLYCLSSEKSKSLFDVDNGIEDQLLSISKCYLEEHDYILNPFNITISLLVNKSGSLDGTPQYDIAAELTTLAFSLDDILLQQILSLWDYLSICALKKKYGRYRPLQISLSRRLKGWQRMWWHYALNSILTDVRQNLRKTSWSTLGERLNCRHKYTSLYKKKLELLQKGQSVSDNIQQELAKMERECDLDDILSYRSLAEQQLQDIFYKSNALSREINGSIVEEKHQNTEETSSSIRNWLSWLSLGMLGAGGSYDSASFAGVVSDEIIKDIYEATEFHPESAFNGASSIKNTFCSVSVKLVASQVIISISNKGHRLMFADAKLSEMVVECRFWEDSAAILASVDSVKIINPLNENVILIAEKSFHDKILSERGLPFFSMEINMPQADYNRETSTKVVLQPFEVYYDTVFFLYLGHIYDEVVSFRFQPDRVLTSLNGFANPETRLFFKIKYFLVNRGRLHWDVTLHSFTLKLPSSSLCTKDIGLVVEVDTFHLRSFYQNEDSWISDPKHNYEKILTELGLQFWNLYDHMKIELAGLKVDLLESADIPKIVGPVIENFNLSFDVASCFFLAEPSLKQLEVNGIVPSVDIHFSESIFCAVIALRDMFSVRKHQASSRDGLSLGVVELDNLNFFQCSLSLKLDSFNFFIAFDENAESCTTISLILGDTYIRYVMEETIELRFIVRMLTADASGLKDESTNTTLCSTSKETWKQVMSMDDDHCPSVLDAQDSEISRAQECFELQLLAKKHEHILQYECQLCLKGLDFHVYPNISGLLQEFLGRLNTHLSSNCDSEEQFMMDNNDVRINDEGVTDVSSHLLGIPEMRSLFAKKDKGSQNTNSDVNTSNQRSLLVECLRSINTRESFNNSSDRNLLTMNVASYGLKVHFHDDSCILMTMLIPLTMSCTMFQGVNTWDFLLCSKGLILTSSWFSSSNQHGILWGPSSSKCFPMLNILVRKRKKGLCPLIEINIGIKHVCCILPSEVLALIIGYFSLPDWTFKGNVHNVSETDKFKNTLGITTDLLYKIEVLESTVILPVENHTNYSLRLEFLQLQCIFMPRGKSADAYSEIPVECVISAFSVPSTLHILNISGKKASASILLPKDELSSNLKPVDIEDTMIPLIAQLDADLWIRIPCEMNSASDELGLLLMLNAGICTLIAQDDYFVRGVQVFADVVDRFSSVGIRSTMYNSDVLQFLQIKGNADEENTSIDISEKSNVSMKVCFKALSIMLSRSTEDTSFPEMIAKLEMQLLLSSTLRNEILQSLDASIPYIIMHSSLSNLPLLSFASNSNNSQLKINLARCQKEESLILADIPFLDIWLNLPDWSNVIDLFHSWTAPLDVSVSSSEYLHPRSDITPDTLCPTAEDVEEEKANWSVKSENITISFHLPSLPERDKRESGIKMPKSFSSDHCCCSSTGNILPVNSEHARFVKFVFQSKCFEMIVGKNFVKSKCNMEKLRAVLEIIKDQDNTSIPLIDVSQVKLDLYLCNMFGETSSAIIEVDIGSLNLAFSHDIIKFWTCFTFEIPATSSPVSPVWHQRLFLDIHLRKGSLLLSDGRWSCHGPMLEVLIKNVVLQFKQTEELMDGLVTAHLLVNYNNIDKVMWEPFVEPWCFQLNLTKKFPGNLHTVTDVYLKSTKELNLNITEPLIEAIFRLNQMVKDASADDGICEFQEGKEMLGFQSSDNILSKRYAPYILHNDTSLPLTFHVFHGHLDIDDMCRFPSGEEGNVVQPGSSVPLYLEETLDEEFFQYRSAPSSERLLEKKMTSVTHHMITIQFDGTSAPSRPMSMDIVGLSFFEANFSRSKGTYLETHGDGSNLGCNWNNEQYETNQNDGLVTPVVFEVSMQHYSKLIRLYSTVLLYNATSVPLELRFEIPFGVSYKILGPIHPGKEFPLPLHLAEASRIRWHPVGTQYLWSEAHILAKVLSKENRLGFLRSFVCYPSHPSSHPFRCCLSIQDYSFSQSDVPRNSSSFVNSHEFQQQKAKESNRRLFKSNLSKKCFIRYVRLTTPLLIKNYLPTELSLTLDCGGVTHLITIPEADTTPIYLVDSAHDLVITFHMKGYSPIFSKFPRAESFSSMAKLDGANFSLSEKLSFYPETSNEPICVILDKSMDAYCGAREICLYVPFLLYNCTGFLLTISDGNHERKGSTIIIPSSYYEVGKGQQEAEKLGLSAISEDGSSESLSSSRVRTNDIGTSCCSSMENYPSYLLKELGNMKNSDSRSVCPCMYSPPGYSANELLVKLSASLQKSTPTASQNPSWSKPFSLIPASGSSNIIIPQPFTSGALLVTVASIPMTGELSGRTRIVTFQPRYVLCNACDNVMSYKQRGTNISYHLLAGQHTQLHWSDTTRELLISLRFNEPGWQWSGSFLPDFLGDTQVKMRNYVTGASKMIRIEIQNADLAMSEKDGIKNLSGHSMTQLIILSDDKTGFMPYRIDNFSMEILRIYQHKCELFETTVHPYSSYQYAWDEPCFPHRLSIEVLGERILGTYNLDDVKEHVPVYMPSTPEKPERRFHIGVHSEGATKVLSVIDSNYHTMKEMKETSLHRFKDKRNVDQSTDSRANFSEVMTIHVPFLGISLINSSPQELVYACARETTIVLMQNLEQQKLSFNTISLQIDNQLTDTSYPLMLSFNNEQRGRSANLLKNKETKLRFQSQNVSSSHSDSSHEPVIYFSAAKWRNTDSSIVSFEYIHIDLAPLCIELEEQILLSLMEYFRVVSSRLQSRNLRDTETRRLDSTSEITRGQLMDAHDYDHKGMPKAIAHIDVQKIQGGLLPPISPVGAPWKQIFLLARKQKKIYIELFELAPINMSLSFSSAPWMRRNDIGSDVESISHIKSTTAFQRSIMALVDVEGMPVHLRQLTLGHLIASWESIQGILIRHYTRQLLHEMYKVFGSAGVIGNPMGFARNVGLGIKDFLSVNGVVKSPGGLFAGILQGSKGLLNSTLYAMSTATSQFSKAAHKGIIAFAFDEQSTLNLEDQTNYLGSHDKGVLDEFFEGLTGLLQSPIRGAERHGLPGVLSGIAIGTAGLVARPIASVLEATGKTAQSIKNWSSPHQSGHLRTRIPRPLAKELPLSPYSWEEAIGVSALLHIDNSRLKDETFVMCKALRQAGKFIVITEKLALISWCPSLVTLGTPDFAGVPPDTQWAVEIEMNLNSIVHIDRSEAVINIVGCHAETKKNMSRKPWSPSRSMPLFHVSLELPNKEEAEYTLQVLLSTVEEGKSRMWGAHILHRSNLR